MILSVGLFVLDMGCQGNESSTMGDVKDDLLKVDFFFKHDSSALCISFKCGHYPTLDSETFNGSLGWDH